MMGRVVTRAVSGGLEARSYRICSGLGLLFTSAGIAASVGRAGVPVDQWQRRLGAAAGQRETGTSLPKRCMSFPVNSQDRRLSGQSRAGRGPRGGPSPAAAPHPPRTASGARPVPPACPRQVAALSPSVAAVTVEQHDCAASHPLRGMPAPPALRRYSVRLSHHGQECRSRRRRAPRAAPARPHDEQGRCSFSDSTGGETRVYEEAVA